MPKTYTFILAGALLATACTPTRPTAQARVALPWSAQQLTDSLKYLLAHVVRMDTTQYQVTETNGVRLFSMRPGATVQGLTVVGPLNVLAAPGNGLPDTIHLPHDSIPHLPGGGLVMEGTARYVVPAWLNRAYFNINRADVRDPLLKGNIDPYISRWTMASANWPGWAIEDANDIWVNNANPAPKKYIGRTPPTKKTKRHAKH